MQDFASKLPPNARQMPHPVRFDVAYPVRLSRLSSFFRLILVIPQLIVTYLLFIPLEILTVIAWFGILFTGRYPKAFFDFNAGVLRWMANVFAYAALLRDEYPPFSWELGEYALSLDIPRAERQSRFRLFVRFITVIPNYIVFYFVQLAFFFITFIAWWAILFTGSYPRGLHKFAAGVMRWYLRQFAYMALLRDEYPPYSISADARPGNEVVSGVIGLPFFVAYVALYAVQLQSIFSRADTVHTSLAEGAIAREHPSAKAGSLRLTLLDSERTSFTTSFDVEAEKDGWLPTFFAPMFFSLEDCDSVALQNERYSVEDYDGDSFDVYWTGGRDRVTIFFAVPRSSAVCALTYFTMGGEIRFSFR
ncbi:MAG: DUF4389 domain-containing protein [Chloroflexi bacterium]|nr:DUF4389 domain-containing protein [Chloroflexota bacterium]